MPKGPSRAANHATCKVGCTRVALGQAGYGTHARLTGVPGLDMFVYDMKNAAEFFFIRLQT